jgi:hypothetical protein
MADVEDTQKDSLGLLQQLNGQHRAEHCHVGAKHPVLRRPRRLDMIAGRR